jgi:hypothetical protein
MYKMMVEKLVALKVWMVVVEMGIAIMWWWRHH